jgi:hypothetical protein
MERGGELLKRRREGDDMDERNRQQKQVILFDHR